MKEHIAFKPQNWEFKIVERTKGRMKIQIKLNKEEAEAFKNFTESIKPEQAPFEEFTKSIFFMGIEYMNVKLASAVKEYAEAHKDELASSGVNVDEILNDDSSDSPDIEVIE